MIVNYKTGELPASWINPPAPYEVLVNGVVINYIWFIDTEAGIVKSYDLTNGVKGPIRGPIELEDNVSTEAVSRVYRGKVELRPR